MSAIEPVDSEERVVVVTGGASGIGAACVRHFAHRGWRVAVNYFHDRERSEAEALSQNGRGIAVQGDVSRDEDCRALAAETLSAFGRIDALVCSAGATRIVAHADLDGLTLNDFMAASAIHTGGSFQATRACVGALKAQGGSVVIVSSYGALYGGGSSIAYAASKGATNTLTMSLARVLAPEVRVNAVCPALVSDGFVHRLDPASFEARAARQVERAPLRKIGRPDDVAANVYWLAAGDVLMTGSILALDCGLHLTAD